MKNRVLIVVVALSLSSCGICGEDLKSETESPDGRLVATSFERNCGATADFVAHVNLRPKSESFAAGSSGTIKEGELFVVRGQPRINIAWKDITHLFIECSECKRDDVYKQETEWHEIAISYQLAK